MVQRYSDDELRELVDALRAGGRETEWIEFKHNNADPERIGRYISALANTAALANTSRGYLVWGIEDESQDVVGTTFNPDRAPVRGQELEFWLRRKLRDSVDFSFEQTELQGQHVVLLSVDAARDRPVEFEHISWVRIGSNLTKLSDWPTVEARLWSVLRGESFETGVARDGVVAEQLTDLLDLPVYFRRSRTPAPERQNELLIIFERLGVIQVEDSGRWKITNLGALLFARDLRQFPSLERRAVRVVQYAGVDRMETVRRQDGAKGYALGFTGLLAWVKAILPAREIYVEGERRTEEVFTDLLLREVIGNALIHQSFTDTGNGPLIEVFSDRVEVTNAGPPLLPIDRLINLPAVSRNGKLAGMMRRMNLCEENGTGWDKIASETERAGLPSPKVEVVEHATRVIVYGPRKLTAMQREDKVRAVYFHACLRWASYERLTNASLRSRFGISASNSSQVSRLISDAIEAGQIALYDDTVGHRAKSYVPYWAAADDSTKAASDDRE
ncbi:RNA-binding domain-containing protein [Curtobacterium sp. BRD11]|uniref:RNA-binding domain-containing protein n=1 Tax=Curtobacterium sp. BRD11 TaxID=2962581 RepID=UPI002881CED2|nr:RNA-binding domain-containing protein [Curtobacterium sp. BRD11]MDT0210488.1 putative DNA binding domain-containing protein [Curtobacterium sp. BRD11]